MSTNNNVIESPLALSELLGFDVTKCQDSTEAAITTQNKVSQLRAQINATINKQCSGFLTDFDSSLQSKDNIKDIHHALDLTIHELIDPNKSSIFSKSENEETNALTKKYNEKKIIVNALKILSELNADFLSFDTFLDKAGNIENAANILVNSKEKYFENVDVLTVIPRNSQIFQTTQELYVKKIKKIQSKLNEIFTSLTSFSTTNNNNENNNNKLAIHTMHIKEKIKMGSNNIHFSQIWSSFRALDLLETKLEVFGNDILNTLITPLIQHPTSIIHLSKKKFSDGSEEFIITVKSPAINDAACSTTTKSDEIKKYTPTEMFKRVFNIINFIYEKIFGNTNNNVQKIAFTIFSNYLWNGRRRSRDTIGGSNNHTGNNNEWKNENNNSDTNQDIGLISGKGDNLCLILLKQLQVLLQQEHLLLKAAGLELLQKHTRLFEEKLIRIGFLPTDQLGQTRISTYINSLDVLEAKKRQSTLLGKARSTMLGDYFNSIVVDENNNSSPEVFDEKNDTISTNDDDDDGIGQTAAAFVLEKMAVTICAKKIISYAHNAFQEMDECTEKGKITVWSAVKDMFSLFCAIVPSIHGEKIHNMPRIAMLHYNDCLYICHHLLIFGHMYGKYEVFDHVNNFKNLITLANTFRQMAGKIYAFEMRRQHVEINILMQNIEEENQNSKSSELAKKGIAMHLSRLYKVWSEVLGKITLQQTIGLLVSKIPNSLFPDIISYFNTAKDIEFFESCRKMCNFHSSQ